MAEVIVVVVTLAFFGVCVAYCAWCDRIIGPDPLIESADQPADRAGAPS